MRKPRVVAVAAAVAILPALVLLFWKPAREPATVEPHVHSATAVDDTVGGAANKPSVSDSGSPEIIEDPRMAKEIAAVRRAIEEGSLQGSEPDGAIRMDENGVLILDAELRRWFDYHLSVVGEATPAAIRAYIAELLARSQPVHLQAQVLAALDRYTGYLASIDQVAATLGRMSETQRDALLRELRRQILGEQQTRGFFAEEEAYADFRQRRAELAAQSDLGEAERAAQLQAAIDALPESVREALTQHQRSVKELELAMEISNSELDPQARFEARSEAFGDEAAARLEQADREQEQWLTQLAADTQMRQQLSADPSLTATQRAERLLSWREQHLDPQQRQRIEALEAIGQLPDAATGQQ
jgi:lipase chaperone LimK